MQPAAIIEIIEKIAPMDGMADWDKSGVQVPALRSEIKHLAVMLDPSPTNVAQALALGADFLVSHHPLTMSPRFADKLDDYHSTLSFIFRHDAWLYSAHTTLDANPLGPVSWLADDLGLGGRSILEITAQKSMQRLPMAREADYLGFGLVGALPERVSYNDFCRRLAEIIARVSGQKSSAAPQATNWTACGPRPDSVQRVAICPGSGSSLMGFAEKSGADVFITGDIKYHTAALAGIRTLDLGHFILEEEMTRRFALLLKKRLPDLAVSFVASPNPLDWESFC